MLSSAQSMHRASTKVDLAIDGGIPVRKSPLAPWPWFSDQEVCAAVEVLRSGKINYWTGEQGRQFEQEYAAATHNKHAVALMNGSVALELALHSRGHLLEALMSLESPMTKVPGSSR